jgi:hypothetical protein
MASVRVEMYVGDDLGGNVADPADRGVEVVGLEPDRDAVAERLLRVSDRAVVMADLEPVQLQDQYPVDEQLLVLSTAVTASSVQHLLIPPAALPYVGDGNHRLRPHGRN